MFFLRAVAAGKITHLVPWLGQQLIVLRSSLFSPRFAASGALRHQIAGEAGQHLRQSKG